MRLSRLFKRLRRCSSQAFRKRHSPSAFRTCRNAGNSVLTAEGTTSKGTGSFSCEVEFCIFYRLSFRTLRTKDVVQQKQPCYLKTSTHFCANLDRGCINLSQRIMFRNSKVNVQKYTFHFLKFSRKFYIIKPNGTKSPEFLSSARKVRTLLVFVLSLTCRPERNAAVWTVHVSEDDDDQQNILFCLYATFWEYNPYCRMFILIDADGLCDVTYRCFAGQVYFKKIISLLQ
jgi:hypothetical protein